jgi:uncharacterized protein (TIGR00730 family)
VKTIAVFCGGSNAVAPMFFSLAEQVGECLAQLGWRVAYGGTDEGMMGALAIGVRKAQGELLAVVPALSKFEGRMTTQATEVLSVSRLSDRKQVFMDISDAFLALPGGVGTFDEIFEVLALERAIQAGKKLFLFNDLGFFEPVLEMLDVLIQQRFVTVKDLEILQSLDSIESLRRELRISSEVNLDQMRGAP